MNSKTAKNISLVSFVGAGLMLVACVFAKMQAGTLQLAFTFISAILLAAVGSWYHVEAKRLKAEEVRAQLEIRRRMLSARFGAEACNRILTGMISPGDTAEIVTEAFGRPSHVDRQGFPGVTRETWFYNRKNEIGRTYTRLIVTLDNGCVVSWQE